MNTKKPEKVYRFDATPLVLFAVLLLALLVGREAAVWALVWVYALLGTTVAVVVSLMAGGPGGRVEVRFSGRESGSQRPAARRFRIRALAVWAAVSALAFAYLVWQGHWLFLIPLLSLAAFLLPGTSQLIADEYVRQVLARGAALAGALALAFGFVVVIVYTPLPLELLAGMAGVYLMTLEWAAWRELR